MKTIIPSSAKKIIQPGANQKYVNSRSGGTAEQRNTKRASIKHENPEYFKRQTDRKHADMAMTHGRGVGQIGAKDIDGGPGSGPKKGVNAAQRERLSENKKFFQGKREHEQIRDPHKEKLAEKFNKEWAAKNKKKDSQTPEETASEKSEGRAAGNIGRGVGEVGRDQAPYQMKKDHGGFAMKQFSKGLQY